MFGISNLTYLSSPFPGWFVASTISPLSHIFIGLDSAIPSSLSEHCRILISVCILMSYIYSCQYFGPLSSHRLKHIFSMRSA